MVRVCHTDALRERNWLNCKSQECLTNENFRLGLETQKNVLVGRGLYMLLARECRSPNKPPRNAPDIFVFGIRTTVGTTVNTPNIRKL